MLKLLKIICLLIALGLLEQLVGHPPRALSGSAEAGNAQVPAGYVKVFGDEFNAVRLDTGKWWTRYIYDDGRLDFLNDEQQRYREAENHVMTGHSLVLMARKTSDQGNAGYSSGMIRSKTTFGYGYFEARMKIPGGVGVRPAFWLNSARRAADGKIAWPPEIDIAEIANNGVEDTTRMLHVGLVSNGRQAGRLQYVDPGFRGDQGYWRAPESFADGFHVFSALWDQDNVVSVFVDGRLIEKGVYNWVYDDGSAAGYAHVIVDLAIGGPKWAGRHGVDDRAFPQGLEIDYLRVYQKPGQLRTGTDAVGHDLCPPQGGC
jgi:beta-glucanase (GH16 family)